jgi:NAD+ kinase
VSVVTKPTTIGLVVHPKRGLERALDAIVAWAGENEARVGQVAVPGQERRVADAVEASDCDVLVAVGGDGTALAAMHAGAKVSKPVLGVACGSIGALTAVTADRVEWALDELAAGHGTPRSLPALDLDCSEPRRALNDIAVVRAGGGQVTAAIHVDGELYARAAGDGVIVSTPLGSSAYTMAARGPLLATACEGFVLTPLAQHGGSIPPLVLGSDARVRLEIDGGHGGARLEVDGHKIGTPDEVLEIERVSGYAELISLEGEESKLAGLRRRGLVFDSPRATLREKRE